MEIDDKAWTVYLAEIAEAQENSIKAKVLADEAYVAYSVVHRIAWSKYLKAVGYSDDGLSHGKYAPKIE